MKDEKEILTIKNLNNIKLDDNNEEDVKDDEEYSDNHEINININSFLVNNNITEKEANKNFEKLFGKRKFYDYMLYTQPRYHEGKTKVSSMWCVLTCILDAYIILYGGDVAKLRDIFVKILQTEYKIKFRKTDKNCTNFKWDFSAPFNILHVNESDICIEIERTKTSKDKIKSIGQKVKDEKKGVKETIKKIITKIIKMTNIQKLAIVNLSSSATSQYWVYKKDDSLKFINLSNGKEIKKPMLILDIIKKIESWYNIEDKYVNEIVKTESNSIQMKSFKDIKKSNNIDKNIFNSKNWPKIDMQEIKKELGSCFKCFENYNKRISKIIKMTNIQKLAIVNLSSSATSQYWVYKKDDSLKFINLSNGKEIKKPMLILDIIKKIESWYNIEDKYVNEIVKTESNSIQMKSFKDIKKSNNIDKNIFNSKNWPKIDMQEIKKELESCFKCFENYNKRISKITGMNDKLATVTLNNEHQCLVYKSETGELQLFNPDSEKPNTENMPLLDRIEEVTDWLNIKKKG